MAQSANTVVEEDFPSMNPPPRNLAQRRQDALDRLAQDVDLWVATASEGGSPYLVPLSFLWEGESVLIANPAASITSRNLRATGKVRLGIGLTRDVILIEGTARELAPGAITAETGDAFAARTGFDPRALDTPYAYFRIYPLRLQAWRESNELDGRDLMRDGQWLDATAL
jgi:hypothetical protein